MAKFGDITFIGKSGRKYTFGAYSWDTNFKKLGGVYIVTQRIPNQAGGADHTRIYIGQTGDISERFDNHHKAACFTRHNANCICILLEENEETRLSHEADLIEAYHPPCND